MSGKIKLRAQCLARVLWALGFSTLVGGCATSHKGKALEWVAIGTAIGGSYGASRSEYKDQNAVMYGAMGAAIGALASIYYNDADKEADLLKSENAKLKKDLDLITNPKILFELPAVFNSKIPDKYKKLVNPGEWRISEIDQWIEDGENRLLHQDKIMELVPPSLRPNQLNQTGGIK